MKRVIWLFAVMAMAAGLMVAASPAAMGSPSHKGDIIACEEPNPGSVFYCGYSMTRNWFDNAHAPSNNMYWQVTIRAQKGSNICACLS